MIISKEKIELDLGFELETRKDDIISVIVKLGSKIESISDKSTIKTIRKICTSINQHPSEPLLYRILIQAYIKTNNRYKAIETAEKAYEKFPKELFFRTILANADMLDEYFDDIDELLGEEKSIESLLPSQEKFFVDDVRQYIMAVTLYYFHQEDENSLINLIEETKELFQENDPLVTDMNDMLESLRNLDQTEDEE